MSETTLTNDDEPRRGQGETSVIFYLPFLLWERNENRRWCVNRQTGDSALRQAISL